MTIGAATLDVEDVGEFEWAEDVPVTPRRLLGSRLLGRAGVSLLEVFTAEEQRARSSQAFYRSALSARLRYRSHRISRDRGGTVLELEQQDAASTLTVVSRLTKPGTARALRVEHTLINNGIRPLIVTAASSLTIGFGAGTDELDRLRLWDACSEWLAENRWRDRPLRAVLPELSLPSHGQDARGRAGVVSVGSWSTGGALPIGVLADLESGEALGWQVESSAGWGWELSETLHGGVLSLHGPEELHHDFATRIEPGGTFTTVAVAISASDGGFDGVIGELTRYRRGQHSARDHAPVIYNDFMNTLMGQPSTEKLLPLVASAADAGAEVFCIDAGWFADPTIGDWWDTVGEWHEASGRFTGGLASVIAAIRATGMQPGLWLEPEVIGVKSPAAQRLPEGALFHRFGSRVREHNRYHLDFAHPAARAHLDETVDRLVAQFGIRYLKLDYNINPGVGTDSAFTPGEGLLNHVRAYREWLVGLHKRHPQLIIENCASGAMRADGHLLGVVGLQSTSDQQDFALYPPIAASAPAGILPEQCGNWAYPSAEMSDEETAFTLVTGLAGRLYLSGFLHRLRPSQRRLVERAVTVYKGSAPLLTAAVPFWPLGLPDWDAPLVCLGMHFPQDDRFFVWDRRAEPSVVDLEGVTGTVSECFPSEPTLASWKVEPADAGVRLHSIAGLSARVFRVTPGDDVH